MLTHRDKQLEELKELEQEVVDVQRAFDDDWFNLFNTIKFIQASRASLDEMTNKLREFKKVNNL